MHFSIDINLIHRASVAVLSSLWNKNIADIQKILYKKAPDKDWIEIERDILSSLRKLELPQVLLFYMENLVQPMGMQIQKWAKLTSFIYIMYPHLPKLKPIKFIWTEMGCLDYRETSMLIIKYNPDVLLCFCLACTFCIEDVILNLWPHVRNIVSNDAELSNCGPGLICFWIHYLNHVVEGPSTEECFCSLKTTYEYGISVAITLKCTTSLNYFMQKLSPAERVRCTVETLDRILDPKSPPYWDGYFIHLLFSYLEEPSRTRLTNQYPYKVLTAFLDFPYRQLFITNVISSWQYLSFSDYESLFMKILHYVSKYAGDLYKNLIKQFWQSTPSFYKDKVKNGCMNRSFLLKMFQYENSEEIIQIIFRDFNLFGNEKIILSLDSMETCDYLVKKKRWHTLKMFVKNCISSPDVLKDFMNLYNHYKSYYYSDRREQQTENLFKMIKEWY